MTAETKTTKDEAGSIVRGAGVVAAGTLLSRILGALRDVVIAASFATADTDMFFVAWTIPNALRGLLAEGAVSAAVVPVYTDVRQKRGEGEARELFRALSGTMLAILAVVSVLGVALAPVLVGIYAAGYAPGPFATTVTLTRIVFPYIFFMGSAALGMGALNAHRRFAVPALAPALLNVAMIAAPFVLLAPTEALHLPAIAALAIGALVGGVLQVVAQWPALRSIGLFRPPVFSPNHPDVRRALRLLAPLTIGLGVYQLNVMLARLFVSYLPASSQSYLYYGQRLVEIPQGMFALALASATLPALAEMVSKGDTEALASTFTRSMRHAMFVALPMSAVLVVCAQPIVAVLFGRGHFGETDVVETARSLAFQGGGVVFIAAVRVAIPMFHARGDTRTPVLASAANLVAFAALAYVLRGPMGHGGVALAISVAGAAQLVVLVVALSGAGLRLGGGALLVSTIRLGVASALAAGTAVALTSFDPFVAATLPATATLIGAIVAAIVVYVVACGALRAPELREVLDAVRRRRAR